MLRSQNYKDQSAGVNLNLVVTPMLDMSFQILFFFVMVYVLAPKNIMEGKMDLNLPAHGERKAHQQQDVNPDTPSDKDLALPANLTVVIKSDLTGNRQSIIVQSLDGGEVALGTLKDLERYLKQKIDNNEIQNKEDIKIAAESKLKYQMVIEVMDTCQRAGFQKIGFNPPPDTN